MPANPCQCETFVEQFQSAIQRKEIVLHYQPIVCLSSRQVEGYEALARWETPGQGILYPGQFLPCLKACQSVYKLCHEVVQQVAKVQPLMEEWISFNVCPLTIDRQDWSDIAQKILASSHIEVTEREQVLQVAKEKLERQQKRGIQVVIDDFGIGYSNFAALDWANLLKIDASLTKDIAENPTAWAKCQAIITLAHACELKVIAEGIETENQALLLRQFQCDYGQGYLFGKPAPLPAIASPTAGPVD